MKFWKGLKTIQNDLFRFKNVLFQPFSHLLISFSTLYNAQYISLKAIWVYLFHDSFQLFNEAHFYIYNRWLENWNLGQIVVLWFQWDILKLKRIRRIVVYLVTGGTWDVIVFGYFLDDGGDNVIVILFIWSSYKLLNNVIYPSNLYQIIKLLLYYQTSIFQIYRKFSYILKIRKSHRM